MVGDIGRCLAELLTMLSDNRCAVDQLSDTCNELFGQLVLMRRLIMR